MYWDRELRKKIKLTMSQHCPRPQSLDRSHSAGAAVGLRPPACAAAVPVLPAVGMEVFWGGGSSLSTAQGEEDA